ncbi:Integrin alpha-6 VLA-6 [Collichthys lucidus]|uniref:Integrin alpha-6 VLA-6 n=1 Tax=Collichthys lucidus TaxID=240159 RepID=A0A4U5UCJ9_COLLU|nr:Integrin alpha-6 VLA-6 [Collichthys lucidus]
MDTRLFSSRYRLLVLLCTVYALSGTRSPVVAAGRSCADTRQVYSEKGYSTGTAPQTQISGEHLRLCPQDYTCCSSQMEETLALQSERDFLKSVEENSQFLLTTFTQRHRKFDVTMCKEFLLQQFRSYIQTSSYTSKTAQLHLQRSDMLKSSYHQVSPQSKGSFEECLWFELKKREQISVTKQRDKTIQICRNEPVRTCYRANPFSMRVHTSCALREHGKCMTESKLQILTDKIMAKHWHMVYLFSLWQLHTTEVAAFNLDTQNVLQKNGNPGSLFGYSIAFHQQLNPAKKNLLLVGAPRSKHQNQVNVTGVVYQCDLTTTSDRCQPIQFDNKGLSTLFELTCAHRYQQWDPNPSLYVPRLVTGQCYLLGDNLQVGQEERKWRRVVCDSQHLQRPRTHAWFAYCQQGHGASFAKDNTSLLFGAPGAYYWKGIIRMERLDDLDIFTEDSRETGDLNQLNTELIPLKSDSYLGFSIDSGMALFRKGELTIVSGAPRGGYSGQVAFLKADPVTQTNLSVELVLSGPGLASSFGYDVAVVDLNGDGWEDLAVGAPEFFVKDGLVGGAVYIYINNKGKNWDKIVPTQLLGPKESMFGLAVENIGDINQDGFGDIAVGAPYDGSGQVYLYYGSSDGIHKKPAQVISSGSNKVTLFGYSLSGNLDVDNNQYPDLAVGSLSDSVFVFRARPVVSVSSTLKVTPNQIDITEEQCDKRTCHHSFKEDIALEITVTNREGDDAHQSHSIISLPDTLHYSTIVYNTAAGTQVSCTANDKGTQIDCDLGNPLQRDAEVTFYVILSTSGISLSTKEVNVTLQLETLARPSQVSLGETLKGESAVKSLDEIGTPVRFDFKIINLGRPLKSFANASLNIHWPKENAVGKWFLYLTQISSDGVQSVPCSPAEEVNPLKDVKGWHTPSRKRREAEFDALFTDGSFLPTRRKHKTLDYSSLNYVDIVVDATLSLTNTPENIGLKPENPGTKVKLTVFFEREVKYIAKIAWWIIFLTVIALLLLLAVLLFLMWKRGCINCLAQKSSHDEELKKETTPLKG